MVNNAAKRREEPEHWEDLSHELWQVQPGIGVVRLMTLDELDLAFKNDEINERSLVRRPGSMQWRTLAEVAGLDAQADVDDSPEAVQLESGSLVPVASEIELSDPDIPRPPPLPRRLTISAVDHAEVDAGFEALAREAAAQEDEPFTEPTLATSTRIRRKPKAVDDELPISLSSKLGRRKFGPAAGFAMVALVGVCVFTGVTAWLTGTFGGPAATNAVGLPPTPAPTPAAPPQVTTEAAAEPPPPAPAAPAPAAVAPPVHPPTPAVHPQAPHFAAAPAAKSPVPAHPVSKPLSPRTPVVQSHAALPALGKNPDAKKPLAKGVGTTSSVRAKTH